jgi:hypothetical protein
MTPQLKSDTSTEIGANGTHAEEPAYMARARRILTGDIRPDDYLPVTPEVRAGVDRAMAYYRERGKGQEPAPSVEPRQLLDELLSFHHGGEAIVFTRSDAGVIVLAVGDEQIKTVLDEFRPRHASHLIFDAPPPWK